MNRPHRLSPTIVLSSALLALVALVAGCSSSASNDSRASSGGSSAAGIAKSAPAPQRDDALSAEPASGSAATDVASTPDDVEQRAVIAKGSLELSTKSVDDVRRRARDVVTTAGGLVADEETDSDSHGRARTVDLAFRVPVNRFDHVLDALAGLGRLEHRSQSAQDVTTQVIDIGSRVRAQRASVASIERLYARATTIGEVMSIEAQLAKRQAALDSLERQQKYLADQTALSTISMTITRTPGTNPPAAKAGGHGGFVGGLEDGWRALATVGRGLAVGLGAVLPWAALVAVIAVPVWLLRRRRRPGPAQPANG
jgi:hypothetical protein